MAKKKRSKRRRRVGGAGFGKKSNLIKLGSLVGGYFLGDTINNMINKVVPTSTTTTTTTSTGLSSGMNYGIAAGEVGLGALLLMSKGGSGSIGTAKTVGGGLLAGAGIRRALKQAGVVSGYQSVPVIGQRKHRMTGYQSVPVIGATKPAQLQGRPAQLQGYRVHGMHGYSPAGSGVLNGCGSDYMQ